MAGLVGQSVVDQADAGGEDGARYLLRETPQVQGTVRRALENRLGEESISTLQLLSRDGNSVVRTAVADTLRKRSGPEALDLLLVLANDKDKAVRTAAVNTLARGDLPRLLSVSSSAVQGSRNARKSAGRLNLMKAADTLSSLYE